ncbi:hypothetical protein ABT024_07085 [Streptomyces sp. NPDC002812]|uniref:hypothetical protein n=1 Tax=Streptomyces sp. NPDC002812 TaxID=3154434 RepID=UPI003328C960
MDDTRRQEIRRTARHTAARELNAITNEWTTPEQLFPNTTERALFTSEIAAIIRRLTT